MAVFRKDCNGTCLTLHSSWLNYYNNLCFIACCVVIIERKFDLDTKDLNLFICCAILVLLSLKFSRFEFTHLLKSNINSKLI